MRQAATDVGPARGTLARIGLISGAAVAIAILLIPAPMGLSVPAWRTAAVGALMAIWWMTEAIPIPATALLPLALFPLLGVADISEAAAPYANPLIFLFLGGFIVAIAMARWSLHRRIALRIIHLVGVQPRRIVTGFAISAAFLSMWVSNTATALMMLPIGLSIVELVQRRADPAASPSDDGGKFATCLVLTIAYACSIGGMATLIGTPPNAFFAGFMLETYGRSIGFLEWMGIGLPLVICTLPILVLMLTRLLFPFRILEIHGGRQFVADSLVRLGPLSRGERLVAIVFTATAFLWISRPLLESVLPGLSDAGIAITMGLVLFILPVDAGRGEFVLRWKDAEKVPWGVLILFGGGLSLASAIDQTGLAAWIGVQAAALGGWHPFILILAVVATIVLLTELTSNTATAAAFVPIAASMAVGLGYDALMFAVPVTLGASAAFMLPVATPPNAIVYGTGMVSIPQMARGGLALNLIFAVLLSAAGYLLVPVLFA